ncbi:MAG: insulinase family protein [Muribaculaceae bacterium]|nr:insulinase family protein [Muribaculaceae bacterium]
MRSRQDNISYATLPCGMRMVHIHTPGAATAIAGVTARVGSRDDGPDAHGIAHMVEHNIFKGTARRSSWHIINRMEAVGGELNAYTTKEETVVYSIYPAGNTARAAELIADLVQNSQFPEREFEKERQVIADEIDSYLDSPADAVYDDFDDMLFAGTPLGHNILGSKADIARIAPADCRAWMRRHYTSDNMVAFYSGPESAARVAATFGRRFAPSRTENTPAAQTTPRPARPFGERRCIPGCHQDHNIIGARIPGMFAPERHTFALLTNILGGPGMNSLLNVALRERRGLVYAVEASTAWYTDCGAFTVYFGCDPADTARCSRLVRQCIAGVADGSAITDRRLEMAKRQYLGQLVVASDNRESRALSVARATLFCERAATADETRARIQSVTAADLRAAAAELVTASSLTLGPCATESDVEAWH